MRVTARSTLVEFARRHSDAQASLDHWYRLASRANWRSTAEVGSAFAKAKVLNGDRVRFEVAGGNYRLIVAFDFLRQIAFVKFVGTHAEYDRIDALTVSGY